MTVSRRFKAGCLFSLFAVFCGGIGFVLGVLAQQTWKKKTEEPKIVKWAAMKHLEKLNPTPEQRDAINVAEANLQRVRTADLAGAEIPKCDPAG